jgi:membrane dipeptidase
MRSTALAALFASAGVALSLSAEPTVRTPNQHQPADPAGGTQTQAAEQALMNRAKALHRQSPLIDGHNDYPWEVRERTHGDLDRLDIGNAIPTLMTDIARLREGGVGAQFWSVYTPADFAGQKAVTATMEQIDVVHRMMRKWPETFELALTPGDAERIFKNGKIASMIGMEGGHSIDSSLGALRMFFRLGARYMTLTHGRNTPWADSATDTPAAGGLTRFGEAVVREINWLGMLVDLSHVSPDSMADALRVAEAPVIFSHSSARALCDVPRNVPDEILRMLLKNGGVVMVSFVPGFNTPEAAAWDKQSDAESDRLRAQQPAMTEEARRAAMREWRKAHPQPPVSIAQVADHVDHIRKVAGIDHVGIGSDFDGITTTPTGLEDVSKFPALTAELLRRGYSDDDVKKVMGLNLLRVWHDVERVAARLQKERGPSAATIEQLDGKKSE